MWKNLAKPVADIVLLPFVGAAAIVLRLFRRLGAENLPRNRAMLDSIGIYPVRDQYYDPLFVTSGLNSLREVRPLPGIDFQPAAQRALLDQFVDVARLQSINQPAASDTQFSLQNPSFLSGDAEIWFHMIRHFKPRRIIEIGSGHSTRMARLAIDENCKADSAYACEHICIEPYEAPWLEKTGATIIRRRVEDVEPALFDTLDSNDILFIDSSHIIRPQGDVIVEILQIMPRLRPGVIVHVHDIFTPRDYLDDWIHEKKLFWNEQYLLEAYLSDNPAMEVLFANNMMKHNAYAEMARACPHLTPDREPGSFYMRRLA